ncbi:unnamed protein product [Closterium sp. NIES-53]
MCTPQNQAAPLGSDSAKAESHGGRLVAGLGGLGRMAGLGGLGGMGGLGGLAGLSLLGGCGKGRGAGTKCVGERQKAGVESGRDGGVEREKGGQLEREVAAWVEDACRARGEGEWMVVMACEDMGGGIPPEEMRWVLDPFGGDLHHSTCSSAADDGGGAAAGGVRCSTSAGDGDGDGDGAAAAAAGCSTSVADGGGAAATAGCSTSAGDGDGGRADSKKQRRVTPSARHNLQGYTKQNKAAARKSSDNQCNSGRYSCSNPAAKVEAAEIGACGGKGGSTAVVGACGGRPPGEQERAAQAVAAQLGSTAAPDAQ